MWRANSIQPSLARRARACRRPDRGAGLVRVDDGPDCHDQPVPHLDRDHADQIAGSVPQHGSRLPVHLDDPSHCPAAIPARHHAARVRIACSRPWSARMTAGTLPPPSPWRATSRQHPFERLDVAVVDGREEARDQRSMVLTRRLEARPPLRHVATCPRRQLPAFSGSSRRSWRSPGSRTRTRPGAEARRAAPGQSFEEGEEGTDTMSATSACRSGSAASS